MDIGLERLSGCHRSLSVPLPILKLGAANKPAKKRMTTSVVIFCAKPAPRMNRAKTGRLMKTRGLKALGKRRCKRTTEG